MTGTRYGNRPIGGVTVDYKPKPKCCRECRKPFVRKQSGQKYCGAPCEAPSKR